MNNLAEVLDRFAGLNVLVIGDLMVDEHVWGTASRVSPEAPVLVVDVAGESELMPGGAANVVNNITALGGRASVIGVVGDDMFGRELDRELAAAVIDTSGIVVDPIRTTTRKTRIWVSHRQQVVRVDRETREPMSEAIVAELKERIADQIADCDAVILSDYNKGVLCKEVAGEAIRLARKLNKICTVNPKPANILGFKGAGLITVNQFEAEAVSKIKLDGEESVAAAGRKILSELEIDRLVITRGSLGLTVFDAGSAVTIPAIPIEVFDVAGAGDTVISALTLGLAAGATAVESAGIGNLAASAAVRKVGVAAVTRGEILSVFEGAGQ